jgi:hypothetical protein
VMAAERSPRAASMSTTVTSKICEEEDLRVTLTPRYLRTKMNSVYLVSISFESINANATKGLSCADQKYYMYVCNIQNLRELQGSECHLDTSKSSHMNVLLYSVWNLMLDRSSQWIWVKQNLRKQAWTFFSGQQAWTIRLNNLWRRTNVNHLNRLCWAKHCIEMAWHNMNSEPIQTENITDYYTYICR